MVYTKTHNKRINNKKPFLLAGGALLFVTTLLLFLEFTGVTDFYRKSNGNSDNGSQNTGINFAPPTDQERSAGDEQKQQTMEEQKATTTPTAALVVITSASQNDAVIDVHAFVGNIYEDGTCTIRLTQGNQVVVKNTTARKDATTTICENPSFQRSEFPAAGAWQLVVSYVSTSGVTSGQSTAQTVMIE